MLMDHPRQDYPFKCIKCSDSRFDRRVDGTEDQ